MKSHRIGRTARAERAGHASTFATMEDLSALRTIEAGIGQKIPSVVVPRAELNAFAREEHEREYELAQKGLLKPLEDEGMRRPSNPRNRRPSFQADPSRSHGRSRRRTGQSGRTRR